MGVHTSVWKQTLVHLSYTFGIAFYRTCLRYPKKWKIKIKNRNEKWQRKKWKRKNREIKTI